MDTHNDTAWLRLHIAHLVRVWTALGMIRRSQGNETLEVFKDVCSDKLRIMLYELAEGKRSLGLCPDGTEKHKRLYAKLQIANEWFTGANGLHARNCSGAHLQPSSVAQHMFQTFGYGGEREWRKLTLGVAACVAMMKLVEKNRLNRWWRELRRRVRDRKMQEFEGATVPLAVEALLVGFALTDAPWSDLLS